MSVCLCGYGVDGRRWVLTRVSGSMLVYPGARLCMIIKTFSQHCQKHQDGLSVFDSTRRKEGIHKREQEPDVIEVQGQKHKKMQKREGAAIYHLFPLTSTWCTSWYFAALSRYPCLGSRFLLSIFHLFGAKRFGKKKLDEHCVP